MSNKDAESSAYWSKVNRQNEIEEKTANPDLLSELETLFPTKVLSLEQEEQYNLYLRAIESVEFSEQQKIMWEMFSIKCYTMTKIASNLGLNKSTVSRTLKEAIGKLRAECEKERIKQFSNNRDVVGFQKGVSVKGQADTDPLFKERMEQHKEEVDTFYSEHPELKEGWRKKNED